MIKFWKKRLKKLDVFDIGLIKWSVVAFTLFVITIWPTAMTWVNSMNPWYFLIVAVIIAARPIYRVYIKK